MKKSSIYVCRKKKSILKFFFFWLQKTQQQQNKWTNVEIIFWINFKELLFSTLKLLLCPLFMNLNGKNAGGNFFKGLWDGRQIHEYSAMNSCELFPYLLHSEPFLLCYNCNSLEPFFVVLFYSPFSPSSSGCNSNSIFLEKKTKENGKVKMKYLLIFFVCDFYPNCN